MKYLDGKLLIQDKNNVLADKYETVTKVKHSKEQLKDMEFGMKIVKNMKSNAIVIVDDCVTLANEYGISAVVQPGGSIKDQDSIDACDKYEMTMVFTGTRHFKH